MFPKQTQKAFTLIEILVTIAIISLLSAILFPVFSTAREKARQTSCLSNLKQLGLAFHSYAQDNDEKFPNGIYWTAQPSGPNKWVYWFGSYTTASNVDFTGSPIYPYTKSFQIQDCPSAPRKITSGALHNGIAYAANSRILDYINKVTGEANTPGILMARIPVPSETFLLGDAAGLGDTPQRAVRVATIYPPSQKAAQKFHGRHNGRAGILWVDGHVKAHLVVPFVHATNDTITADVKRFNLGDLLHPNYPQGHANQNYYYELNKPT